MNIEKIDQVGIAVKDARAAALAFETFTGIGPFSVIDMPPSTAIYRGKEIEFKVRVAMATVGGLMIELMQILEGEHLVKDFLEERGQGIHHLGVFVDDLGKAVDEWKATGREVIQVTKHTDGMGTAYLDTEKELGGIYLELIKLF
jgi:Glyoxalase/Bleomycin resistance protein/Dioxygenase superfamily